MRFKPKPAVSGFLRILQREGLEAKNCIMVEDSLVNLVTAKKLGMKTVWVSTGLRRSVHVDVRLSNVTHLPQYLGRL